jgi:hypothetical protein
VSQRDGGAVTDAQGPVVRDQGGGDPCGGGSHERPEGRRYPFLRHKGGVTGPDAGRGSRRPLASDNLPDARCSYSSQLSVLRHRGYRRIAMAGGRSQTWGVSCSSRSSGHRCATHGPACAQPTGNACPETERGRLVSGTCWIVRCRGFPFFPTTCGIARTSGSTALHMRCTARHAVLPVAAWDACWTAEPLDGLLSANERSLAADPPRLFRGPG